MIYMKLLFIIIFFCIGVLGGYHVFKGFTNISAAQNWRSVSGVIDSVNLQKKTGTQKRPTTTTRTLHYRYNVNHTEYHGEREYFGVQMARHAENSGGYQANDIVDVYYNPLNPSQSVLKPKSYRGIIAPLLISLLFLITSGYLALIIRQ